MLGNTPSLPTTTTPLEKVPELGEQVIEKLVAAGITTVEALADMTPEQLEELPGIRIFGPRGHRGGLVGFAAEWAHPHDLTTYANEYGIALRGGHHCNQPLMRKLRVPGTNRASFYFYNHAGEVDRLMEVLTAAHRFFTR